METIKDLWASLVASVSERSTNPLTSAFIVSWAIWNYKFFVVLFNDEKSSEKFSAIAALYPRADTRCFFTDALCMPPDAFWGSAFVYPALTTVLYVFAYPFLTLWVVSFYRTRQVNIANELKKVEGNRVRTVDEVTRMVRDYEKRLTDSDGDTHAARNETEELRKVNATLEEEIVTAKRVVKNLETLASNNESLVRATHTRESVEKEEESKSFSWVVQGADGKESTQEITASQARILHLIKKVQVQSAAEIAGFLGLPLKAVDTDLKALRHIGALALHDRFIQASGWGRTILQMVNKNGAVDKLNEGIP